VEPLARRTLRGSPLGAFGGLLAAVLLGVGEAAVTTNLSGPGDDMQVLWYAVVLYGAVLAPVGAGMGAVCAALPLPARFVARWTPVVTFGAMFFPLGLAVSLFRLQRDLYAEHRPPFAVILLALLGVCLVTVLVAGALWRAGADATSARGGRPLRWAAAMLGVWIAAAGLGVLAGTSLGPDVPASRAARSQVPVGLASRPNLVLVVVDTLRADHLGAYGDRRQLSPNVDAFARDATVLPCDGTVVVDQAVHRDDPHVALRVDAHGDEQGSDPARFGGHAARGPPRSDCSPRRPCDSGESRRRRSPSP
jgi:hypothetical protein